MKTPAGGSAASNVDYYQSDTKNRLNKKGWPNQEMVKSLFHVEDITLKKQKVKSDSGSFADCLL